MQRSVVRKCERGFTLLELMVVVAVLGLALSLVLLRGPASSPTLQFDAAVRRVTDTLSLARSRAIADDRLVTVGIAGTSPKMDGDTAIDLPTDFLLAGDGRIAFTPDGGSSGGHILLRRGAREAAIDIDWLTGRVQLRAGG